MSKSRAFRQSGVRPLRSFPTAVARLALRSRKGCRAHAGLPARSYPLHFYVPLTEPVGTLEKDDFIPEDPPVEGDQADPPGPREGAMVSGLSPWLVQPMRAAALPVASHAVASGEPRRARRANGR